MLSTKYIYAGAVLACLLPAFASAQSVQITNVSPSGVIAPGSTISFIAAQTGFGSPTYAVADAYVGSGATTGSIDTVGYFTWTPTVNDGGWHAITVTVSDAQNHVASSTVNIRVASTVVLVSNLKPGPVVSVGKPVTFSLSAPGFITPQYAVYDTSWRSSVTPADVDASGNFTWTPTIDDIGSHTLAISASDPYGNHAQGTLSLQVVNPAVAIQNLVPGTATTVGSKVSFSASAGMLSTTTAYSVTDTFSGTSTVTTQALSSSGVFNWVPTAADVGTHTLTVTAADAYGNAASSTVTMLIAPASASSLPAVTATAMPSSSVTTSSAAASLPAPAAFIFTKTLALGSRGAAVTALQNRLSALGLYNGPITGYYGPMTAGSVRKFQKAHGLSQVGFVGPGTRAALNK